MTGVGTLAVTGVGTGTLAPQRGQRTARVVSGRLSGNRKRVLQEEQAVTTGIGAPGKKEQVVSTVRGRSRTQFYFWFQSEGTGFVVLGLVTVCQTAGEIVGATVRVLASPMATMDPAGLSCTPR